MHTILLIAKREVREALREGRFRWCIGGISILLLVSFVVGWHDYRSRKTQYEQAEQSERRRWLGQQNRSPHTASEYGVYIFRRQLLLSSVDPGIEQYVGMATHAADQQELFQRKPAEDTRALHRFGEITTAATLQIAIPLVVILLLFPLYVGDREQGTLRLTMSIGIGRSEYVWGKLLGALSPLLAVLVPGTVLGVVTLHLLSDPMEWDVALPRLAGMVIVHLAYFSVIGAIAIGVSARAGSSRMALLLLLSFWFTNSLVVPQIATEWAESATPTPSGSDIVNAIKDDQAKLGVRDERVREVQQRLLRQYGVDELRELPVSPVGVYALEAEDIYAKIYARHFGELFQAYEKQNEFVQHISLLSPSLGIQAISMALAGTDPIQQVHLARAIEKYRRQLVRTMAQDIMLHRDPTLPINTLAADYLRGREVWEQVPPFEYQLPAIGEVLRAYRAALIALTLWLVGSLVLCIQCVRRSEVD